MAYDLTKLVKLEGLQQLANETNANFQRKNEIIPIQQGGTGNSFGYIRTGQRLDIEIGLNATSEGQNTAATGENSHAEGTYTIASGETSHAEGRATTASGKSSHAEGSVTTASGIYSHAEGATTTASAGQSHAEGMATTASETCSHAEGHSTIAAGAYSHAQGHSTIANTRSQFVFGEFNIADPELPGITHIPNYTHIEIVGNGTNENERSNARTLDWDGNEVLAGKLTVGTNPIESMDVATKQYVDNSYTIAGKQANSILGTKATAEGYNTEASGNYSHAEGYNTKATHNYSHVEGEGTVSVGSHSHVFGKYNTGIVQQGQGISGIPITFIEAVGNGEDSNNLSNARTLDWDGNEKLAGKLTVGADPVDNMDVATKQYVDGNFTERFNDYLPLIITFNNHTASEDANAIFTAVPRRQVLCLYNSAYYPLTYCSSSIAEFGYYNDENDNAKISIDSRAETTFNIT